MADGLGTNFVEMNLGNVADGELETQFLEELEKVVEARANLPAYEPKGSTISCSIRCDVEFRFDLETGAVLVATSANFKPPKRKKVTRAAFMRDGRTLVEDAVQIGLLDEPNNVRPISAVEKEGTNNDGD